MKNSAVVASSETEPSVERNTDVEAAVFAVAAVEAVVDAHQGFGRLMFVIVVALAISLTVSMHVYRRSFASQGYSSDLQWMGALGELLSEIADGLAR